MGRVVVNICSDLMIGCCWKVSKARSPSVESGGVSSKDVSLRISG